jgi:hypothetical protein
MLVEEEPAGSQMVAPTEHPEMMEGNPGQMVSLEVRDMPGMDIMEDLEEVEAQLMAVEEEEDTLAEEAPLTVPDQEEEEVPIMQEPVRLTQQQIIMDLDMLPLPTIRWSAASTLQVPYRLFQAVAGQPPLHNHSQFPDHFSPMISLLTYPQALRSP